MRRRGGNAKQNTQRLLTGVLGSFMLLGGVAKFFEPFTTMFAQQITLSRMPFANLAAFSGQAGEIASGVLLLAFFAFGSRLVGPFFDRIFYLTNLLIVVIMLVAVYVHLHLDVPAEVLPFQSKPPVLTIIVLLLAVLNMQLHRRNHSPAHA